VSATTLSTIRPVVVPARSADDPVTPTRLTYLRRRAMVVVVGVLLAFALTVAIGRVGAEAELADRVAGHVVVEPGQTLWDIAVDTAPAGIDARQQLDDLRSLNGLSGAELQPWDVILLPAR
jgi:hypothetical protein